MLSLRRTAILGLTLLVFSSAPPSSHAYEIGWDFVRDFNWNYWGGWTFSLAPSLDQHYDPQGQICWTHLDPTSEAAQTFTAGISGTLDRLELTLEQVRSFAHDSPDPKSPAVVVEVRRTFWGYPVGQTLGSVTLSRGEIPMDDLISGNNQWVTADFSHLGISLQKGEQLAIVVRVASGSGFTCSWHCGYSPYPTYPGGLSFYRSGSAFWSMDAYSDYGFKAWVAP